MNKTDNKIDVSSLSFRFDRELILDSLSFDLAAGTFLSIIGPNGSGKTTLLRTLYGWLAPSKNAVLIEGRDVTSYTKAELAKRVAHVAQEIHPEADFTVEETVRMGRAPHLKFFGRETCRDREKVEEALRLTETHDLRHRLVTQVSGGEFKRVMIACALAQDTQILLLDEPTAHLDIHHEQRILSLLKKMQRKKRLAVIAVFHDLNSAALYSERIILLDRGRIAAEGPPEAVLTAEILKAVYETDLLVLPHPETGRPCVLQRG